MEQWAIDEIKNLREYLLDRAMDADKYRKESVQIPDQRGEDYFMGKVAGLEEALEELDSFIKWFARPEGSQPE